VAGGRRPLPTAIYRLGYVSVVNITDCESINGPDEYPDPLIPDVDSFVQEKRNAFPLSVPAGENRQVLVDLFVPPDTTPGTYSGFVTVTTSSSGALTKLPFQLTVQNFTLPSTSSMGSEYGLTSRSILAGHQLCHPGAHCPANASSAAERFSLFTKYLLSPYNSCAHLYNLRPRSNSGSQGLRIRPLEYVYDVQIRIVRPEHARSTD
jgi:hypothetical protein